MNSWVEHDLVAKILTILGDVRVAGGDHQGRPFLTAFQIATALYKRYPDVVEALDFPAGERGSNRAHSVVQCVAQNIAREMKAGNLDEIEAMSLPSEHLSKVAVGGQVVAAQSWPIAAPSTLSLYRLRS